MNILYLGDETPHTSSWWRARALARLGHEITHLDLESRLTRRSRFLNYLHYRTGYALLQSAVRANLKESLGKNTFDLVWVDGGAIYGPEALGWLRSRASFLVNYNLDDPMGPRDWKRWITFRGAVPCYDLCVVVREQNILEYHLHGAKRVAWVLRSYDEVEMSPRRQAPEEVRRWASEVLFVGTWMPERCMLMAELLRLGVPLSIYGNRWNKSPAWPELKRAWRGAAVVGPDYISAMQTAKIGLGLVSHGNRDLHTLRTFEIPAIGSLFMAERTSEHSLLYQEGREAEFYSSPQECAAKCLALLKDDGRRVRIACAGAQKVSDMKVTHSHVLSGILRDVTKTEALPSNPILGHLAKAVPYHSEGK